MKVIILFLIVILLAGCNNNLAISDEFVENRIDSFIMNEERTVIDINSLTDFSWDKAYIFIPYTSSEEITEKINFKWKYSKSIEYRDDINLIVFVKGKNVVSYIELLRKYGDFSSDTIENGIYPENSIISVKVFN